MRLVAGCGFVYFSKTDAHFTKTDAHLDSIDFQCQFADTAGLSSLAPGLGDPCKPGIT
jgi:hypothetical protein